MNLVLKKSSASLSSQIRAKTLRHAAQAFAQGTGFHECRSSLARHYLVSIAESTHAPRWRCYARYVLIRKFAFNELDEFPCCHSLVLGARRTIQLLCQPMSLKLEGLSMFTSVCCRSPFSSILIIHSSSFDEPNSFSSVDLLTSSYAF